MCLDTNSCAYTFLYITPCIYIKLTMNLYSLPLIYYHRDLVPSPCRSVNSHSNSEKPGSHHWLFISFIVQFWSTGIAISNLLMSTPWEITSTRVQCLCAVPLAFSLSDITHFQSYLAHTFSAYLPQKGSFIIVMQLGSCLHSFLESLHPLSAFCYLPTLRVTLCVTKFCGFWQMSTVVYLSLQYHIEWFHHPESPP